MNRAVSGRGVGGTTWCVLVAAGSGSRLGGDRPKAFAGLAGRPLLAESLARLDASDWIDTIVVAAPEGWEEPTILLAEELVASKVAAVVTGGETRAESVRAALEEVADDALVVLVHDAARPLVGLGTIDRVVASVRAGTPAIAALPVVDTLKETAADGAIVRTVDRTSLWRAQTPQGFPRALLVEAHRRAREERIAATDDAALCERLGHVVRVVRGSERALKVTEPGDFARVEALYAMEE